MKRLPLPLLLLATDKPAYPRYFEDDNPSNGEGFESAVAYPIADQLGYPKAKVKWTVESFNASFAPGPKDFDFDVNQISTTPPRDKAVDFSAPYYAAVARAFWFDVKLFVLIELAVLGAGLVVALVRFARSSALFPLRG